MFRFYLFIDLVCSELIEDDYDLNKAMVQKWLIKIPDTKFDIVSFSLVSHLLVTVCHSLIICFVYFHVLL
jgi:hypothetical protein